MTDEKLPPGHTQKDEEHEQMDPNPSFEISSGHLLILQSGGLSLDKQPAPSGNFDKASINARELAQQAVNFGQVETALDAMTSELKIHINHFNNIGYLFSRSLDNEEKLAVPGQLEIAKDIIKSIRAKLEFSQKQVAGMKVCLSEIRQLMTTENRHLLTDAVLRALTRTTEHSHSFSQVISDLETLPQVRQRPGKKFIDVLAEYEVMIDQRIAAQNGQQ